MSILPHPVCPEARGGAFIGLFSFNNSLLKLSYRVPTSL